MPDNNLALLDKTKPDGAQITVSQIPSYIRETRSYLKDWAAIEHGDAGMHKFSYGGTAARPATPIQGSIYLNTDAVANLEYYTGAAWTSLLSLGTMAAQNASAVSITGGALSALTSISLLDNATISTGTGLRFSCTAGGQMRMSVGGLQQMELQGNGVTIGPTGLTYFGVGTLNLSSDIYRNGTAYTNPDYVFEKYYTDAIKKNMHKIGAAEYTGIMSLNELREFVQKEFHFPNSQRMRGAFERMDFVLEKVEEAYIHLFNHEDRIKGLEDAVTTR